MKEWHERTRSETREQLSNPNFSKRVQTEEEIDKKEVVVEDLLAKSRLKTLNLDTVMCWMNILGYRYKSKKVFLSQNSQSL